MGRALTQYQFRKLKLLVRQRVRNDELLLGDDKPHVPASTCVYYDIIFDSRTRHEKRTDTSDFFSHQTRTPENLSEAR